MESAERTPGQTPSATQSGWRRRLPILLYHSIGDHSDPFAVTPNDFTEHVAFLLDRGWVFADLGASLRLLRTGRLPPRHVCITFDDAYEDFARHALPVLERHRVPAVLYVPTALVGGRSTWHARDPHRQLLSDGAIRALPRPLITIGSHTAHHPRLTELTAPELEEELRRSLQDVRTWTGDADVSFAYPYGAFGRRERDAAAAAGYDSACTVDSLWGNARWTDWHSLERILVRGVDTGMTLTRAMTRPLRTDAREALWTVLRRVVGRVLLDATGSSVPWHRRPPSAITP